MAIVFAGGITGGPHVCSSKSTLQCYQPSSTAQLKITTLQEVVLDTKPVTINTEPTAPNVVNVAQGSLVTPVISVVGILAGVIAVMNDAGSAMASPTSTSSSSSSSSTSTATSQ